MPIYNCTVPNHLYYNISIYTYIHTIFNLLLHAELHKFLVEYRCHIASRETEENFKHNEMIQERGGGGGASIRCFWSSSMYVFSFRKCIVYPVPLVHYNSCQLVEHKKSGDTTDPHTLISPATQANQVTENYVVSLSRMLVLAYSNRYFWNHLSKHVMSCLSVHSFLTLKNQLTTCMSYD